MKAVKKYGPQYDLIADEIKTRGKIQIMHRLTWLLNEVKADKSHPDRATLLAFEKKKKRLNLIKWTPKET